jgi:glycosyltransferase involved in cell wall biosynthesis
LIHTDESGEPSVRVGILSEYPPYTFGGIGPFTQNLSEALAEKGVEVVVVAPHPKKHPVRVFDRTHRLRILWLPMGPLMPRHMWFQLENTDLIRRELSDCDVIHGQDIYAYPLLELFKRKRLKTPWIITFHTNPQAELYYALKSGLRETNLGEILVFGAGFPVWDATVRQHSSHADRLVCVTKSLRDELSEGYALNKEQMTVIHTCVDVDAIRREINSSSGRHDDRVRLFYAGRLYYRKGILHLMRILARLAEQPDGKKFMLSVFGRGPLGPAVKKYAAERLPMGSVEIRGHVDRETFLQELSKSDIFCMPSLYEACPMAMIEAMSLGKPVIAFNLPFAREILGDNIELLASDADDYRIKLSRLISSPEERKRLSQGLLERSDNFDASKIAAEYGELYEGLI